MPSTYHDLDWPAPVNWAHPLNVKGLVGWWLCLPTTRKGLSFVDLRRKYGFAFNNMSSSAWIGGNRPNGFSALSTIGTSSQFARYSAAIVSSPPFTISFWFKGNAHFGIFSSTSNDDWYRLVPSSSFYLDQNSNGGANFTSLSGGAAQSGAWNHIVGVWTSSSSRSLYGNGAFIANGAATGTPVNLNRTTIGALDRPTVSYGSTTIDDIRIHNRALNGSEVLTLYRESLAGYPNMLRRSRRAGMAKPGAAAAGILYPRLERGIRGLNRGLCTGTRG